MPPISDKEDSADGAPQKGACARGDHFWRTPSEADVAGYRSWCADTRPDLSNDPGVLHADKVYRRLLYERILNIAVSPPEPWEGPEKWRVFVRFASTPSEAELYLTVSEAEAFVGSISLCRAHGIDLMIIPRPLPELAPDA